MAKSDYKYEHSITCVTRDTHTHTYTSLNDKLTHITQRVACYTTYSYKYMNTMIQAKYLNQTKRIRTQVNIHILKYPRASPPHKCIYINMIMQATYLRKPEHIRTQIYVYMTKNRRARPLHKCQKVTTPFNTQTQEHAASKHISTGSAARYSNQTSGMRILATRQDNVTPFRVPFF